MTGDPYGLERFVLAQDAGDTYRQALAELRRGRKLSHWMWFVFPQLAGLGRSERADRYAISSIEEARAYWCHPLLGPRLVESAHAVAKSQAESAVDIFGTVDAQKLRSCMTLFASAAPQEPVFGQVLARYYAEAPDPRTEAMLASGEETSGSSSA